MRGRARVTCSNSGHSRTPHPLTPHHWQTHCHGKLTTGLSGNHWHRPPAEQCHSLLRTCQCPPCLPRPCHVSRSGRARVTLAHVSSLSRGLSSCGLCHVSRSALVTQCCHDSLSVVSCVCCHGLSHTDTGLSPLWPQCLLTGQAG